MLGDKNSERGTYYVSTLLVHTLITLENFGALKDLVKNDRNSLFKIEEEHLLQAFEWIYEELMKAITEREASLETLITISSGMLPILDHFNSDKPNGLKQYLKSLRWLLT